MYQVPPQISKWSESYYLHNRCLELPNIDSFPEFTYVIYIENIFIGL